jgi:hypothetical protein
MAAGHTWHPYRTQVQEAQRWKKAIQSELKKVNAELDG